MDPSMASSSSDGEGPRSASTGSRRATADGSVAGSRSGSSGRRPGMQLPPPLAPNTVEAAAEGQVMYMSGPGGGGGSDRPSYANDQQQQQQLSSSSSSSSAAAGGGAMYANASAESTKQAANPAALYATPQKNKRPRKKSGGGTGTLERPQTHYANADAMAQSRPGYKNVSDAAGGASASPVYAVPENISGGGSSSGAYRNTEGVAASSAAASPTYAVPTSTAGRSGRGSRGSRGSRSSSSDEEEYSYSAPARKRQRVFDDTNLHTNNDTTTTNEERSLITRNNNSSLPSDQNLLKNCYQLHKLPIKVPLYLLSTLAKRMLVPVPKVLLLTSLAHNDGDDPTSSSALGDDPNKYITMATTDDTTSFSQDDECSPKPWWRSTCNFFKGTKHKRSCIEEEEENARPRFRRRFF